MRLLPTPVVSFADVRIGDAAAPDIQMERFRAEVELASLLRGEVRIIRMDVARPHFRIDLAGLATDAQPSGAKSWNIDPARISLTLLQLEEGSADIVDSRAGRTWRAENLNAVIEAGSLRGPGSINADLTLNGQSLGVRAGLGRMTDANEIPTTLFASSPLTPLTLSTDGMLWLPPQGPPRYSGAVTIAGPPASEAGEAEEGEGQASPWTDFRGVGAFEITPEALTVAQGQITYSATERPLVVEGSGRLDLGSQPHFDVSLKARQFDLDRTVGTGPEKPVSIAEATDAVVAALPRLPVPPFPGTLHVDAQGVVLGGGVIQAVRADLITAAEGWRIDNLTATLPGETRVDVTGDLRVADAPEFRGHARAVSSQPAALSAWWRGRAGSAAQIDQFAIEADVELGSDIQKFSEISAEPGGGTVSGSVELRRFEQSGQLFASVVLSADEADLTQLRALGELLAGDLVAGRGVDQMTLSLTAEKLHAGGMEARSVLLDGGFENGALQLSRFSVADLAGASVEARGSVADPFGEPTGRIDGSLQAEDLTGAVAFLAGFMPEHRLVTHLQAVAPKLSPAKADISASFGAADEPLSLDLTGSFAGTDVTLTAQGQGSINHLETLSGMFNLHVNGDESSDVLAQLGMPIVPVSSGPLRIDADFQGALASPGTLKVDAAVAGVQLTYLAETAVREGRLNVSGDFDASSSDIDPILLLSGLAVPGLGEGHAAAAAGRLELAPRSLRLDLREGSFDEQPLSGSVEANLADGIALRGALALQSISLPTLAGIAVGARPDADLGAWNSSPFAASLPAGLTADLDLTLKELELGPGALVTDAAVAVEMSAAALNIDLSQGGFAGGRLAGSVGAKIQDGAVDLALRASLGGAPLQALSWERGGLPVVSGTMDASLDVTGSGRSMAGLVANLSGSGSFAVNDGRFNALNPEAITAVMASTKPGEDPDEEQARETFAILFGSGALPFGRAAGSFSVGGGVLDVPTVSIAAGGTTVLADAAINLNTFTLASDWTIRQSAGTQAADAAPYVTVRFSGPISEPQRQIDLAPLLELIRSRTLQQQLDEIEALEEQRRRMDAQQQSTAAPAGEQLPPLPPAPPAPGPDPAPAPPPGPTGSGPAPAPALGAGAQRDSAIQVLRRAGPSLMDPVAATEAEPAALPYLPVQDAPAMTSPAPANPDAGRSEAARPPKTAPAARSAAREPRAKAKAAPARSKRAAAAPARREARPARAKSKPRAKSPTAPQPAQVPQPPAPPKPEDGYRVLGNGVIVKVR